jgi:hypothetical protein
MQWVLSVLLSNYLPRPLISQIIRFEYDLDLTKYRKVLEMCPRNSCLKEQSKEKVREIMTYG